MLKDFAPRLYQQTIFAVAARHNTMVVLPTGMGKTGLALLSSAHRLEQFPDSKVLMLAPSKPLCEQHVETMRRHLKIEPERIVLFTGSVKPQRREELWKDAAVVVSTPQGLENDVINERIDLSQVSLLIFDEAHHARGEYAYVWLAKKYREVSADARILALTASPGSDTQVISEVCENLGIEKVEIRTSRDFDVRPYMQEIKISYVEVNFPPELADIQTLLKNVLKEKLGVLEREGLIGRTDLGKGEMLLVQREFQKRLAQQGPSLEVMRGISVLAEALKVEHGVELLESQGLVQLEKYMDSIVSDAQHSKVKAVKNLVADPNFQRARAQIKKAVRVGIEHPKLAALAGLLRADGHGRRQDISRESNKEVAGSVSGDGSEDNGLEKDSNNGSVQTGDNDSSDYSDGHDISDPGSNLAPIPKKTIVFTQFRDSADVIIRKLEAEEISGHIFIGQAKRNGVGFSQKRQKEVLAAFAGGKFEVLVATSVAEEGLDIPSVDLVVFYEPIPSAIRAIQRRGRTGRLKRGKVKVLVTKGTRDEAYRWSAYHREKFMQRQLQNIRKDLTGSKYWGIEGSRGDESGMKADGSPDCTNRKLSEFAQERGRENVGVEMNTVGDAESAGKDDGRVLVLADHREKNNVVVKELMALGARVRTVQLKSADYILSGSMAVEMKKVKDFVDSIVDGRMLEQLLELRKDFGKVLLLVEGTENIYQQRNVHPNSIRGMMATIVADLGIPIMWSRDSKDSAAILYLMAKREQERHGQEVSTEKKARSLAEQQQRLVATLPGVGMVGSRRMLEKFGTIKKLAAAREDELEMVEGIGAKTAKRLLEFFEVEYKDVK